MELTDTCPKNERVETLLQDCKVKLEKAWTSLAGAFNGCALSSACMHGRPSSGVFCLPLLDGYVGFCKKVQHLVCTSSLGAYVFSDLLTKTHDPSSGHFLTHGCAVKGNRGSVRQFAVLNM